LGIYGNYPSTATFLTGGPSLEIGLYAHLNFMRGAVLAKSCYMPKIVKIRGGWKLSKALYAQKIYFYYGLLYGRNDLVTVKWALCPYNGVN